MIISASRRTDIPAHYSEWFFERLKSGYVYVRNPVNPRQISEVSLSPDTVDGIVFWTKNPLPMLDRIHKLRDYTFYFQFTLTSYGTDIERNVPSKSEIVIPAFRELSALIGKERVVWRYDPILLSDKYTLQYHLKYFRELCSRLAGYTEKCTVSFLDVYKKIERNISALGIRPPERTETEELAAGFAEIAFENGIYIDTCAEAVDLSRYGIGHAACVDRERLERIGGYRLNAERDKNQRDACGCVSSVDVGAYNTCPNGCAYCYANINHTLAAGRCAGHNPASPMLYGEVRPADIIKPREAKSLKSSQMNFFD